MTERSDVTDVAGFDVAAVERWLPDVAGLVAPLGWKRLAGGYSNLTYRVTDSVGSAVVLRRPPLGNRDPRAHDMSREYRVVAALWPTAVPVARPIAFVDRPDLADAPFYVMTLVPGRALLVGSDTARWLDETARGAAGDAFIDALAMLHSLDPAEVGLADLGPPDGYVERQLRCWYRSWTRASANAGFDDPRMHELHAILSAKIPPAESPSIVHGDFGPHNALFLQDGTISAVLDWELATLGQPSADLAYSINLWVEAGDAVARPADPPTALPGFPSRDALVARYAAARDVDLAHLPYFRALGYFKSAGIAIGVYARHAAQPDRQAAQLTAIRQRIDSWLGAATALAYL